MVEVLHSQNVVYSDCSYSRGLHGLPHHERADRNEGCVQEECVLSRTSYDVLRAGKELNVTAGNVSSSSTLLNTERHLVTGDDC